ncbi:MAG: hypothetical protein IJ943_03710 [Akkermansia sp.]|nr:hypothetical protein [Akkermansia sp.]MBR3387497.1 hypothetical protein [Bacteroidales bacterium]
MAKKNKSTKTIKQNIARLGTTLKGMVAAPGIKKGMGVSRAESVALSYGLSMGIGIGFMLSTDSNYRKEVFGPADTPITREEAYHIAGDMMFAYLEDLPEHRAKLLAAEEGKPGIVSVTIERQEVR